jgi:histidinol phosphatase-like PHP family hydrolase
MPLFDHHIHSDRSDGTVSLADRAKTVAVRPHGVSDHFPWRDKLKDEDDVLRYMEDAARLGLRVGLEYDLGVAPDLRSTTRDGLHYLIGALHQLYVDGKWIHFDDAGAFLKGRTKEYGEAAKFADPALVQRMRERTLEVVSDGIERVGIDILGHATMSPLTALGDPEVMYPPAWQEQLIQMCIDADVAIEVNETYGVPHRAFLERAQAMGARFSVGSDTHFELRPLDKTMAMIEAARLDQGRFLQGARVRKLSASGRAPARG